LSHGHIFTLFAVRLSLLWCLLVCSVVFFSFFLSLSLSLFLTTYYLLPFWGLDLVLYLIVSYLIFAIVVMVMVMPSRFFFLLDCDVRLD